MRLAIRISRVEAQEQAGDRNCNWTRYLFEELRHSLALGEAPRVRGIDLDSDGHPAARVIAVGARAVCACARSGRVDRHAEQCLARRVRGTATPRHASALLELRVLLRKKVGRERLDTSTTRLRNYEIQYIRGSLIANLGKTFKSEE